MYRSSRCEECCGTTADNTGDGLLSAGDRKDRPMITLTLLNAELNPICHLLELLGSATIVVVSTLRVKVLLLEYVAANFNIVTLRVLSKSVSCHQEVQA